MGQDAILKTYSVKELLAELNQSLKIQYPDEIWVKGMIQGYSVASSGHTYFNLVEKTEEPGAIPNHLISVALFSRVKNKLALEIELENGLEIRILGKASIYEKQSKFQIMMSNIDENYTTSKLKQNKKMLLENLSQEGLLELNKNQPLNTLPLKIALITSKGSAAYKDFEDELLKSGFGWEVYLIHTSVQGENAPAEICAALQTSSQLEVDVVALIRGGGSSIDLAAFDNELVARTIANMRTPVFCGIGHELDFSIADAVAHTTTKTPTACARTLIDIVKNVEQDGLDLFQNILLSAQQLLQNQNTELTQFAYRVALAPKEKLSEAKSLLDSSKTRLQFLAEQILSNSNETIKSSQAELIEEVREFLQLKKNKIKYLDNQIQTLDPKRFLEKGWSITCTEDGKLIKDTKHAPAGTLLITQLSDGRVKSEVLE